MIDRLDYTALNAKAVAALAAAKAPLSTFDPALRALVELRVSQINGCAYCVDLHAREARDAGESQQKIDCLIVWHECSFYTEREKSAFAWAEAITEVSTQGAPDELYDALFHWFTAQEIVDLSYIIAQMNAWNRLAIAFRHGPAVR